MARPKGSGSGSGSGSGGGSGSGSGSLSPGQAAYVIERLISERRISPGEINRLLSEAGREISDLESRLARLREIHGGGGQSGMPARRGPGRPPGRPAGPSGFSGPGRPGRPPGRPPGRRPGRPAGSGGGAQGGGGGAATSGGGAQGGATAGKRGRRAKSAITPQQLASRQLQGRYLALVRQFPAARRAAFAKTAKEKGREAAIREMQDQKK